MPDIQPGRLSACQYDHNFSDAHPPRVPGDRRYAERAARLREGIELPDALVQELDALAAEVGAGSRLTIEAAG